MYEPINKPKRFQKLRTLPYRKYMIRLLIATILGTGIANYLYWSDFVSEITYLPSNPPIWEQCADPEIQRICSLNFVDCNCPDLTKKREGANLVVPSAHADEVSNHPDEMSLNLLIGTPMEEAIPGIRAAMEEYPNVDAGWFTGVAGAESSLGKHYYIEYDKYNCHNAWGIKPPGGQRADGSYLRCYDNWEVGAKEFARIINKYIEAGNGTVRGIAPYYKCGGPHGSASCLATVDNWIGNVDKYSHF